MATIARATGVSPSTVKRRLAIMEGKQLIRRVLRPVAGDRHKTNLYEVKGLIEQATPLAQEELKKRLEKKQSEQTKSSAKGKPQLAVVK